MTRERQRRSEPADATASNRDRKCIARTRHSLMLGAGRHRAQGGGHMRPQGIDHLGPLPHQKIARPGHFLPLTRRD